MRSIGCQKVSFLSALPKGTLVKETLVEPLHKFTFCLHDSTPFPPVHHSVCSLYLLSYLSSSLPSPTSPPSLSAFPPLPPPPCLPVTTVATAMATVVTVIMLQSGQLVPRKRETRDSQ